MPATTAATPAGGSAVTVERSYLELAARVIGVAMLALTAVVHLRLYSHYGYRHINNIGTLFLLNVIGGFSLAVVVLGSPRRLLGLTAFAGAGYEASTLAGFVYALYHPLFGFQDSTRAPLWKTAVTAESIGIVVLAAITLVALNRWRSARVLGG
jgi:hypothetical protein